MECVILCGGRSTRLGALTDNLPKSLLQCGNHPFIHYQLSWLKKQGINNVLLCIGYLGEMIEKYVADGSHWGLNVSYVYDGKDPCGTGGALRKALDENKLEENFFILYGDSFLPIDLNPIIQEYNGQALMTIYYNQNKLDKSNIKQLENNQILYNKKNPDINYSFIDYGLSLLNRSLIKDRIPANIRYDLGDLFYQISQEGLLTGYKINERFYEIGSLQGIQDFNDYLNDANKL